MTTSGAILSTILKHDSKVTSYKIALLRAINDVVFAFPLLNLHERSVAVPLRLLAERWLVYYWPFVEPEKPLWQGQLAKRSGGVNNDMAFRPHLTKLRVAWETLNGGQSRASDGYFLSGDMRLPRKHDLYPAEFLGLYGEVIHAISHTLQMPIRYAGPGEWTVFEKPQTYRKLAAQWGNEVVAIPGTKEQDVCLVVPASLWHTFAELSLWIEALCIHEWCLFTERVSQNLAASIERGAVYQLLTDRPDNRRPLSWERNHIDLLLMEGKEFICPWTKRSLGAESYAIDHLFPVSVYPINELWNLVPTDATFNSQIKRDRLPDANRLSAALPLLERAYQNYQASQSLRTAMQEDVAVRFSGLRSSDQNFSLQVAQTVVAFIETVATSRNLTRF